MLRLVLRSCRGSRVCREGRRGGALVAVVREALRSRAAARESAKVGEGREGSEGPSRGGPGGPEGSVGASPSWVERNRKLASVSACCSATQLHSSRKPRTGSSASCRKRGSGFFGACMRCARRERSFTLRIMLFSSRVYATPWTSLWIGCLMLVFRRVNSFASLFIFAAFSSLTCFSRLRPLISRSFSVVLRYIPTQNSVVKVHSLNITCLIACGTDFLKA
mmetsp:Transcript_29717/g.64892  ORF Transcript_29717/g.64892 Transcript_29717/m.64892 type:complete len:221 (+) Transcript_29717:114-776(+)